MLKQKEFIFEIQMSSKLSQIQKIVSYKSFLDFHLVYKNKSCLKFLREKKQTIKIGKNDKNSSNLHLFLFLQRKKTIFGKISINNLRPNLLIWFDWNFFRNKMKIKSQIFSVNSTPPAPPIQFNPPPPPVKQQTFKLQFFKALTTTETHR